MWRFVLKENIRRFEALMGQADSDEQRETLRQLIGQAKVELDELEEASTPDIAKRDALLRSFADRAVDEAMGAAGAQFGSLQIFDERRDHLIILAQRNLRATFLHHLANMKPGDGSACGRCLLGDTPVAIADVNGDPEFEPHRELATEAGFQAVAAVPVRDRAGKLIAVLSTYFEAPQFFSDAQMARITSFAEAIGSNLERHLGR